MAWIFDVHWYDTYPYPKHSTVLTPYVEQHSLSETLFWESYFTLKWKFFLNVMRSSQCFSNLISEWKLRVSTNASLVPSLRTVIFIPRFARQKISPCSLTNSACANPNFSFTYQITAYCRWCWFPYFYLTLTLVEVCLAKKFAWLKTMKKI